MLHNTFMERSAVSSAHHMGHAASAGAGPAHAASAGAGPATPQMLPPPPPPITEFKELGSMDSRTGTFTGNKKAPAFRMLGSDPSKWFSKKKVTLKQHLVPKPPTRRASDEAMEHALAGFSADSNAANRDGSGGRRKRRSAKRTRRYKKGSRSKTTKGRKDFTTKKRSKYFDRRGRRSRHAKGSRKKRRPYSRRK